MLQVEATGEREREREREMCICLHTVYVADKIRKLIMRNHFENLLK
jgi:hypothetical protein